ncbi:MAG: ABC transporter permease [Caldiserica bacterium]|nr:ABC transporter permease [Caldisericota bacterium]MDH7562259.1 ABC transporter permease [Caldisericota bacterium]
MKLWKFIGSRLLQGIVVLIGLSIVIFLIARVMPGDPARIALGPLASDNQVEEYRKLMGFDKPITVQYWVWLNHAIRGDLGISLFTHRPVAEDIIQFFPATLELCFFSILFEGLGGIILGVIAGRFADKWIDNVVRIIAYIGVVTPPFVFAIIFMLIFGYWLHLLPTLGQLSAGITAPPRITGMIIFDSLISGNFGAAKDGLLHILLPALSLALGGMSQDARITRSGVVDNMNKDYVGALRSCGVPNNRIMFKYLLKPSLIPTVSMMGLSFAYTFANAFLVETIFGWPGISRYGMNAILNKDLNSIVGVVMVLGVIFILVNLLVDIIVAYLDPRIRLKTQ